MRLKTAKSAGLGQGDWAAALTRWYAKHRRDLPWRPPLGRSSPVDPYAVLVSEFMLQQTQVATVKSYFNRFMEAFPKLATLASASEHEVLRCWQGLGYYSRARNLHGAARQIQNELAGEIPTDVDQLTALPGIGRYTAGAISSIAFGQRAPILDGNVARVLCRLAKIQSDPREPKTVRRLWALAEEILPTDQVGEFNSALMELGATICTPRDPRCSACPIRQVCQAAAAGLQNSIPLPRKSRPSPTVQRWTICIRHKNRWLVERRPATGRWAGLWQFPTIEPAGERPTAAVISEKIGLPISEIRRIGQIRHALTHRRYIFTAFVAATASALPRSNGKWIRLSNLADFPVPMPQLRIAGLLRELSVP